MSSNPFIAFIFFALLFILSCKDSPPTATSDTALKINRSDVTVAQFHDSYVSIVGGNGPLRIQTLSDSSIAYVFIAPAEIINGTQVTSIRLTGRTLGSADIMVQDSAGKAKVTFRVTVAVIAADPSSITYKENSAYYTTIKGGKPPYAVAHNSNPAIASAEINGATVWITTLKPGMTVITIKDSFTPERTATISVTVTAKPVFTTPGTVSFSSSFGEFSVNGIYVEPAPSVPPTDEGAGGWLHGSPEYLKEVEFIAYKRKDEGVYDILYLLFDKLNFSAGNLGISIRRHRPDSAYVYFVRNANINLPTIDKQVLTSGTVVLSSFSEQSVSGTFSGSGPLIQHQLPVPGQYFSIQNGSFSVPLIPEDYRVMTPANAEQLQIKNFVQQEVKKKGFNRLDRREVQ